MTIAWTYKDHTLHVFAKKDETNDDYYEYEVEMPDGKFIALDVHPYVRIFGNVFRQWVELGCPDRFDLKTDQPLTSMDIEVAWYQKFNKYIKPVIM